MYDFIQPEVMVSLSIKHRYEKFVFFFTINEPPQGTSLHINKYGIKFKNTGFFFVFLIQDVTLNNFLLVNI